MIIVGTPFGSDGSNFNDYDESSAIPVGDPAFIHHFLDDAVFKVRELIQAILLLPQHCSVNKPALQTALILLRSTAAIRVGHLARILAPSVIDSFARDIDDAVTQGFLALADLPQPAQHTAVGLPLRQGGPGLPLAGVDG